MLSGAFNNFQNLHYFTHQKLMLWFKVKLLLPGFYYLHNSAICFQCCSVFDGLPQGFPSEVLSSVIVEKISHARDVLMLVWV